MKLHLPVGLFSALMAALCVLPAFGRFTFSGDSSYGKGVSEGVITKGYYNDVKLTIEKEDGGDTETDLKTEGTTNFIGDNNIIIGQDCSLEISKDVQLGYLSYTDGTRGTTTVDLSGELKWSSDYPGDTPNNVNQHLFCLSAVSGGVLTANINIRSGGKLNCTPGETGGQLVISHVGNVGGSDVAHMNTNITVEKGGTFYAKSVVVGRVFGEWSKCTTSLTLDGGVFDGICDDEAGSKNTLGQVAGDYKCSLDTSVTVKNGGQYKGGDNSVIADTAQKLPFNLDYWEGQNAGSIVQIDVDGADSTFSTGGSIGIVSKGTSSSVTINVTNGGEFVLHSKTTGGAATVNTSEVPSQVGDCSTIIKVKDAVFAIEGAAVIGMDEVSDASITICGDSTFKLDYTDGGTKPEIYADVVMEGGHLQFLNDAASSDYQKTAFQRGVFVRSAASDILVTVDLGGLDASLVKQVSLTNAGDSRIVGLMKDTTLTFREGDQMVVGEQHVYRKGQTEPAGETMVQFQDGKGQIAFDESGKLQLHLESEVLKGLEGQLEILFTNGSFSGMPEGGQKELEAWLGEHFVLDAGLEDIKVLLLSGAEGGRLILTGSSSGIWIASRNGQNVDVADLLNHYSAVIADENLTLTLPTAQEETPTIVHQLQNEIETHGDFIVKTESGATANHTVQLHNENVDGDNGDTEFYGDIRVEGTGLEAATLEKTGNAALNVHGNLESSGTVQVKEGTLALSGEANSIGTLVMSGGELQVDGTLALTGATEMNEESSGSISGTGNVKLGSGASLTLAGGVSYGVQNTQLENGAQMSQKGEAAIKGGVTTLSGEGTSYTQSGGTISGATFSLGDGANLTQSKGTIDGVSITLSGGASMRQDGGQITGGTLELSGGATMTSNGTVNGTSVTLSGEGTGFTQAGGSIGEDATFLLKDGATLTLSGGSMNAAVTMEGEASLYDLGNQAAGGSITMRGGNLAKAGSYEGTLAIWTDATYTGSLDLGGVDAARITKVQIGASETEMRNLKSDSTLTFREGDEMVVGVQHVYREGQTEPTGGSMVQFQGEKGQIAFDGDSALRLHLKSEVLKGLEGQLEILFTNGSFSGMPEGGQKELKAWLGEHFVLDAGLEDIEVLLLNDAEGGHLILTGSSSGIWIASRNGQNVDVADLLYNYSAVIADKDLTLTLPATQEETPTIVNQLQNERETHGDFIVKTESGATANHTVQLHNANTNGDNGGTEFYGSIRVEGMGPEAATLEKTGDAALNVYGNVESSGTVQVKEGSLALGGTANSIGTLAMSGGELQVNGTLALTGATEMSEGSSGSISGTGNVKLGSGASLTLAGGVSYRVQNTQLDNGAQMSQKGEAAIKGGSIALSGKGTGYTQAGGTISGTTFTLAEGASFAQAGGSIDGGAAFSLSDGANLTQSKGAIDGASITLSGSASMRQDGGQITGGTLDLSGGATMTQSNGTINGTSVTLSGEGTSYTQAGGSTGEGAKFSLSDGAKLTLSGGSMNGAVTMEGKTSRYDLGNQAAQGSITMHGGSLANAGNYAGSLAIQTGDTYTGALDLGGVDAARITSIQLEGKDTYLTGLKEGSTLTLHTDNSFKVTEQNAWVDGKGGPEGKQAFFQFGTAGAGEVGTGSVVDVASGAKITLNFVGQQIAEAVGEDGGITLNVWITNGQLGGGKTGEAAVTWAKEHFVIGTGWGLDVESYDAAQGMLVLKGQSNIWDASVNGEQVNGHAEAKASELGSVGKVVIDENTVVTVDQDATIHQLDGEGEYSLELKNDGEDDKTITLHNQSTSESALGSTGDTVFGGDILAGEGVNLKKTGDAALAVQGSLKAEGDVTVEKGELVLGEAGEHSIGGDLSLGEDGTLQVDGSLTLSGTSELSEGKLSGGGTIEVSGKDASLTFGDERMADDSELKFKAVDGGTLNYTGSAELELTDLTGNGHYKGGSSFHVNGNGEEQVFEGTVEGSLSLEEGNFNLTNPGNGSCDLYVVGKDTQATIAPGSSYHSITVGDNVHDNDKLIVSADAEGNKAGAGIRVTGNIVFRNGAETDFTINLNDPDLWGSGDHDATMLSTTRTIYIEQGTTFVIDCLESNLSGTHDNLRNVVILEGATIENPKDYDANAPMIARILVSDALSENTREEEKEVVKANVHLGTILDQLYENVTMTKDEQKVYINADARTESPWMTYATTSNSGAGLNLLWKALSNAGGAVDPQVEGMFHALQNLLNESPAAAQRVMSAVAGSTLTSVSAAQSAALRNQTSRVRDHALQAARLRCAGNDEATQQQRPCKTTHVWVEGTSFFSEQHSIGDESGYRLNSWGGAVGIDAQVNAHWSVGLSLAASYGDLEARAADYAKGDLDSYYVSAWSQAKNGRWGNTLLFTVGTNEADLRRTVNYGAGSYTATSNASGSSLGAMWELTCDFHPVKENKSNILQPMFNVAVQHTSMDGFSEKNAGNVGLAAEKQTRDTMTLGLGLRWLAAIDSAKAVNRTVSTELHANVAQDLGDRRSVANVALLTDPNFTQSVYGSKTGSTAFQFGAGVNAPMTPNSCIYVNAGGELREHANTWNATLGVRMGF